MSDSQKEKQGEQQPHKEPTTKVEGEGAEEVVGEDGKKVSKNQQKYLDKQKKKDDEKKKKDEEKKAKEEEDGPKGPKKDKKQADEEIIDPVLYYESRSKIIKHLKDVPEKYPYPHKFEVTHTHKAFHAEFNPICTENNVFHEDKLVSVAGTSYFWELISKNANFGRKSP